MTTALIAALLATSPAHTFISDEHVYELSGNGERISIRSHAGRSYRSVPVTEDPIPAAILATSIDQSLVEACSLLEQQRNHIVRYSENDERAIDSMMNAIFDERCPGIRWCEEDRPVYRRAAIAALRAIGVLGRKRVRT